MEEAQRVAHRTMKIFTDVKAAGVSLTSKPNGVPVAKAILNPVVKASPNPVAKAAAISHKENPQALEPESRVIDRVNMWLARTIRQPQTLADRRRNADEDRRRPATRIARENP